MARSSSKTQIFNLTLGHLKSDPVENIDPPTPGSKAAAVGAKWYDDARRSALEEHPWGFAKKRMQIQPEAAAPLFEYSTKYELPPDYIRLIRLGELWWNDQDLDYTIEDGYILCNETGPLDLVYVYDIEKVTKFSPKFIIAFSYRLAQFAGYEITGSQSVVQAMEALFTKELTTASSIQGQNRPTRRVQRSKLQNARMNQGRNRGWKNWGPD